MRLLRHPHRDARRRARRRGRALDAVPRRLLFLGDEGLREGVEEGVWGLDRGRLAQGSEEGRGEVRRRSFFSFIFRFSGFFFTRKEKTHLLTFLSPHHHHKKTKINQPLRPPRVSLGRAQAPEALASSKIPKAMLLPPPRLRDARRGDPEGEGGLGGRRRPGRCWQSAAASAVAAARFGASRVSVTGDWIRKRRAEQQKPRWRSRLPRPRPPPWRSAQPGSGKGGGATTLLRPCGRGGGRGRRPRER